MLTLQYQVSIHAPIQKVWNILWDTHTYSMWTQFFSPSSSMQSDWKIGGETLFKDANGDGMVATIVALEQFKTVVFQHQGVLKNGVADCTSEEVQQWRGALEKYVLEEADGVTLIYAQVETLEPYQQVMDQGFRQGFAIVKKLAEAEAL